MMLTDRCTQFILWNVKLNAIWYERYRRQFATYAFLVDFVKSNNFDSLEFMNFMQFTIETDSKHKAICQCRIYGLRILTNVLCYLSSFTLCLKNCWTRKVKAKIRLASTETLHKLWQFHSSSSMEKLLLSKLINQIYVYYHFYKR